MVVCLVEGKIEDKLKKLMYLIGRKGRRKKENERKMHIIIKLSIFFKVFFLSLRKKVTVPMYVYVTKKKKVTASSPSQKPPTAKVEEQFAAVEQVEPVWLELNSINE